MAGPLKGVCVLDLSRVLAGPWATQILADLGASVIKIEKPYAGDDTRGWGPPYLKDRYGRETNESAYYLSANRGKRSAAIDISKKDGAQVIRRIAKRADILIENFKVGALKKYHLDFHSLRKTNPRLIYCSITGFGQTGPRRYQPGYDFIIQGMGGLMSVTGNDVSGPQKVGVAIADITTGLYAAVAVLGALFARGLKGKGQHIDMSLLDVQTSSLANQAMNYLIGGRTPERLGNSHPNIVPYQSFSVKDGFIIVAVGNDSQFTRLVRALDLPALAKNPDFINNQLRVKNRKRLASILEAKFLKKTRAEWISILEKQQIPTGAINNIAEVFKEPQVKSRAILTKLHHPLAGMVPSIPSPIRYSNTKLIFKKAPPLLGQHTDEILKETGYSKAAIIQLKKKKIVFQSKPI